MHDMQYVPAQEGVRGCMDHGPGPFIGNLRKAVCENRNFRTAFWTGGHLQLTLMCIPAGGEIGFEIHHDVDQFLRVEHGRGLVKIGCAPNRLEQCEAVGPGSAIFIPAGTGHNLCNTGNGPLKLYSVYAPPQHPPGTVHRTKEIADAEEAHR